MDLFKTEVIAAGGALIISAGGFWYTSTKIDELNTKFDIMQKSFITQIAKMSQHDDDIKITNSKVKDFVQILEDVNSLKESFNKLTDEISDEFEGVKKTLSKQNEKMRSLSDKLEKVCQSVGFEYEENHVKEKTVEPIRRKKLQLKKIKKTTEPLNTLGKAVANHEIKSEDIFSEMDAVINS